MIYSKLYGRCGNQLFQYSFAKQLSMLNDNMQISLNFDNILKNGRETKDPTFDNMLKFFNVSDYSVWSGEDAVKNEASLKQKTALFSYRLKRRMIRQKKLSLDSVGGMKQKLSSMGIYFEDEYGYEFPAITKQKNIFTGGYFENPEFFSSIENILKNEFTPIQPRLSKNMDFYKKMEATQSICVSVRKWDAYENENNCIRSVCDEHYYRNAINIIKSKIPDAVIFVFSNDIEWAKNIFKAYEDVYYEDGSDPVWEKLRLMYSCKHFIISNSTFAWWAQYLSRNKEKIVISPHEWKIGKGKNKLISDNWITI